MFDAHAAIEQHGYENARRNATSKFERVCVDAAAAMRAPYASTESVYASLLVTALPHRAQRTHNGEATLWNRNIADTSYRLLSGNYHDGEVIGIPFGSKARLILIYLHEQVVRHESPVISVVPSMHAWAHAMGIRSGGITYQQIAEQARRICGCRLEMRLLDNVDAPVIKGRLIDALQRNQDSTTIPVRFDTRSNDLREFPEQIIVSELFYRIATSKLVRLCVPALRLIGNNSWAIDIYIWLAHQLPLLTAPIELPWNVFLDRADLGHKHQRQTKASFIKALPLVLAIYPEARVQISAAGIVLFPSSAPVPAPASQNSK